MFKKNSQITLNLLHSVILKIYLEIWKLIFLSKIKLIGSVKLHKINIYNCNLPY